jgi:hypothetical protein
MLLAGIQLFRHLMRHVAPAKSMDPRQKHSGMTARQKRSGMTARQEHSGMTARVFVIPACSWRESSFFGI